MGYIVESVYESIKKYCMIDKGDTVICGLSGGPDSVCMLHVLDALKDRLGIELVAVHINHMIRGAQADEDMKFSEEFAKSLGVRFLCKIADIPNLAAKWKVSEEEAGRKVRYETFRETGKTVAPYKIAVAHNSNDVAETFFFNLARGAGLEGLCSIKRVNGDIVRPLLDIYRDEIMSYLNQNRLPYKIDCTNLQCEYTRNRIRNKVIPVVNEALNTDITRKIMHTTALLEDDLDWLKECGKKAYESCKKEREGHMVIYCEQFNELPVSLKRQVVRSYMSDCIGGLDGYGSFHVNRLMEMITGGTPSSMELPGKYVAILRYGELKIEKNDGTRNEQTQCWQVPLNIPGETVVPLLGWRMEALVFLKEKNVDYRQLAGPDIQFFDFSQTGAGLTLRNRRNGDVFRPLGLNGTKKLKDYFIDRKVEKEKRAYIPLVEGKEGILWVTGYGRSELAKVTEETERVLRIRLIITKGENLNVQ